MPFNYLRSWVADLVTESGAPAEYRRFVLGFFAFSGIALVLFGAFLWGLRRADTLPPPPLTATSCMDEKFKFLAQNDKRGVDLIAVGSSVTWRNVAMAPFVDSGLVRRPMNAAPCYLHMSETAYFTEFLLDRMKDVRTVLTVVAPRDFESCEAPSDAFFSDTLAAAYVFHRMSSLPLYYANFKPERFFTDVMRIKELREDRAGIGMDAFGSGPLLERGDWLPPPVFSDMCFEALTELERVTVGHGARLVVVAFPLQPAWHAAFDPHGDVQRGFERRLSGALRDSSSVFISSDLKGVEQLHHADAVHYLWDSAQRYSALLVDELQRRGYAPLPRRHQMPPS